jgi:ribosome-associated protein
MNKPSRPMRGLRLLKAIAAAAADKKADDVTVLSLSSESGIADWFIICQGDNALHNRAIADNIASELGKRGVFPWHTEGASGGAAGAWIVMDFSDVIVHVMTPQVRDYYCLEELWKPVDMNEIEIKSHE